MTGGLPAAECNVITYQIEMKMHFFRQAASNGDELAHNSVATRRRTTYDRYVMVPEPQGEG
ncbi:hypothetical protein MPL1032_200092 [Mesorhizobium plurifarium]|uniref:Uncharacterized protein n=1 Tax=Mesorhizobium plurifarium TaxID=69974 RepID=A0A0K2VYW0_MESPL|nr:hypothetical protein MPL1032_200092 [Mesorhizobium plurifarium]